MKERSYLVIEAKEVRTVKEVIRSDGLWRFACGDVFWWLPSEIFALPVIIEGNGLFWVAGIHSCEEYCGSVFDIKAGNNRGNRGGSLKLRGSETRQDHSQALDLFQTLRCCIVVEHWRWCRLIHLRVWKTTKAHQTQYNFSQKSKKKAIQRMSAPFSSLRICARAQLTHSNMTMKAK